MSRMIWLFGIILLLGSILGAGWIINNQTTDELKKNAAKEDVLPPKIISLGFVDAHPGLVKLYPVQTGRIVEVVAEGSRVDKGDVLLKLDDRLARFKKLEAEADVRAARELLKQAQQLPEKHKKELEGQEAVIEAAKAQRASTDAEHKTKVEYFKEKESPLGKSTLLALDEMLKKLDAVIKGEQSKLAALKLVDPDIDIHRAEADVQAKEARLEQAELAVKECSLLAPSAGTVLRVHVHSGEILGANPTAPAIQFAPAGPKIVRAEVLQEWAREVHVGQSVTIADDTHHEAGETWQGRVKDIAKWFGPKQRVILEPFMLNDVRTLECLIEVTSEGPRPLLIGQRVRVTIQTK